MSRDIGPQRAAPASVAKIEAERKQANRCKHKWKVIGRSFDYESGCEQIVFQRCVLCDTERECDPPCFDDDMI